MVDLGTLQGLDMSGAESADQLQLPAIASKSLDGETGLLCAWAIGDRAAAAASTSFHFTPLTRVLFEEEAHTVRKFLVERSQSHKHTRYANTHTSTGSRNYQQ
jgi:hypothetical protein